MSLRARFALLPAGALDVSADDAGVLRHFRAEYGTQESDVPVLVRAEFVERLPHELALDIQGHHKTVHWEVSLGGVGEVRVTLVLRGWPQWFGLSLVQGYIIEPLVSVAGALHDQVLLPAAAIAEDDGALLILGRSRSGKSSLVARALVAGRPVLGDDQVVVHRGMVAAFPRRVRVYDDLAEISPKVYEALPASARLSLRARRAVRLATRGYVAPSYAISHEALGGRPDGQLPIRRIVFIERRDVAVLAEEALTPQALLDGAAQLLREQRRHLLLARRPDWTAMLDVVENRERAALASSTSNVEARRVILPAAWGPGQAITALAHYLGLPG